MTQQTQFVWTETYKPILSENGVSVRRARVSDGAGIHHLIDVCSQLGFMLRRTMAQIFETIQEFVVAEFEGQIIGCAALHVDCDTYGEIRSVAVDPSIQGRGVGRLLVESQVENARSLHVRNVFVLTDKPDYFARLGFTEMDKSDLPRKIWRDCANCPAFPECHEVALARPAFEG